MLKICVMYLVLPRNYLKNMKVIPFGLFAKEKPANAGVLLPVSMSVTGGYITDV